MSLAQVHSHEEHRALDHRLKPTVTSLSMEVTCQQELVLSMSMGMSPCLRDTSISRAQLPF